MCGGSMERFGCDVSRAGALLAGKVGRLPQKATAQAKNGRVQRETEQCGRTDYSAGTADTLCSALAGSSSSAGLSRRHRWSGGLESAPGNWRARVHTSETRRTTRWSAPG